MSLQTRLFASFLLLILLTLSGVVGYAWVAPFQELEDMPHYFSQQYAWRFTPFWAESYAEHGDWREAAELTAQTSQRLPPAANLPATLGPAKIVDLHHAFTIRRVVLATAAGQIVADSTAELAPSAPLPAELRPHAVPILHQGQTVGQLVVLSGFDEAFVAALVAAFRRVVLAVGVWATAVAALVSWGLARRLAQPVTQLQTAVHAIAHGASHTPLPITRRDEIGQLTASFNEMSAALTHQKELRQQMVADIAHELRTPLSIWQLELEALEDGLQAAETAVPTLKQELANLERLINDLRLLSLADAHELQLTLGGLETADFLHQTAQAWRRPATTKGVALQVVATADLPPLWADEGRLYQVLHNLLANALAHTAAGGRIELGGRAAEGEVVLWVADTGVGIAAEELPYLFDRFYRAAHTQRETGGSGLGLAIAKRLVGLHHGRIWATSAVGRGTTLWVAMPLAPVRYAILPQSQPEN